MKPNLVRALCFMALHGADVSRVYLSGPMTGLEHFNAPLFHEAAKELRDMGYMVSNPAEIPNCDSWLGYMRLAVAQLVTCDAVLLLPEWEFARSARIELSLAHDLGLLCVYLAAAAPGQHVYMRVPEIAMR